MAMFWVNHCEGSALELPLEYVTNELRCVGIVLRLGYKPKVVHHKAPLADHLFGDNKGWGSPLRVPLLQTPSSMNSFGLATIASGCLLFMANS